ncbi:MAG TPA: hypothetical protein VGG68_03200 [Caulobacteraceae bacterium]|jgi:hypothetical protein
MFRTLALIGGLVLLTAADSPPALESAFKGTIISTYPDGRTAELWMSPGGTYVSMGRKHDRHTGTWKVKGDKVCFKRGMFGYCTAIPTESASFTTKAVTGETIQVRLVPGRREGHDG